jgi:DNA-cytosine methyltransferase|tara:strand:- start:754 stop:1719 length:966 start_codon:yes stop_codon:yes gene_type:complete
MNVLSLFDGMSGAQLALRKAGVKVDNYYASEIDKYAVNVTKHNFPNTIHLGSVVDVKSKDGKLYTPERDEKLHQIDILIGGSPCQGFSFAGKQLNFNDPRSKLFFEYVRLLKELKPRYFLLENVNMNKKSKAVITKALGVEPIFINSKTVSAQNRQRLYWTNIPFEMPTDKGIMLKDILEDGFTDREKSYCLDANYFRGGNLKWYFEKHRRQLVFSKNCLCHVGDADIKANSSTKRVYHPAGKSPTLTTMGGGHREPKVLVESMAWRKLTVTECERLQTVPEGYTAMGSDGKKISNTQRYKMLGNGFTVDVIAHILNGIKN